MLRVRDALALDVFQRARAEVVAGASGLDRVVRWVHISDLAEVSGGFRGGELVLTHGIGLVEAMRKHVPYLRALDEAGIAGLVVELGDPTIKLGAPFLGGLPAQVIAEADRLGLPLVVLHEQTMFVEVTEVIHTLIIDAQHRALEQAERIGREFSRLALDGAAPEVLVNRLAEVAGNPVYLENSVHQVVAFAPDTEVARASLEGWAQHSRMEHAAGDHAGMHLGVECRWLPVHFRGTLWGRLHLLAVAKALSDVDVIALERAATAIGFALLAQRDDRQTVLSAIGRFLASLRPGTMTSPAEFHQRAQALGADFRERHVAVVVVRLGTDGADGDGSAAADDAALALREAVDGLLRERELPALCSLAGNEIVAIVGVEPDDGERDTMAELGRAIGAELRRRATASPFVAISDPGEVATLHRGLEEARSALDYAERTGESAEVLRGSDLRYQQLLLKLAEGPHLARFVEDELGPLLDRDARRSVALLPTLRAYIDNGGNKAELARQLFLGRRSLYHRLDKIEALLGRSLENPEVRARLSLALRGLQVLQPGEAEGAKNGRRKR